MWGENSKLYKGFVSGLPINLIDITVTLFQSYFCPHQTKKDLALDIFLKSKQFSVFLAKYLTKIELIFFLCLDGSQALHQSGDNMAKKN